MTHDLTPELQAKIRLAFTGFDFKASTLGKEFKDSKAFIGINYADDWKTIRDIQKATGANYTAADLAKLKRE